MKMQTATITRSVHDAFTAAASAAGCPLTHDPTFRAWLVGRDLRTVRPRQGLASRQNPIRFVVVSDRYYPGNTYTMESCRCGASTPHLFGNRWLDGLDITTSQCQRCGYDAVYESAQIEAEQYAAAEWARRVREDEEGRAICDAQQAEIEVWHAETCERVAAERRADDAEASLDAYHADWRAYFARCFEREERDRYMMGG